MLLLSACPYSVAHLSITVREAEAVDNWSASSCPLHSCALPGCNLCPGISGCNPLKRVHFLLVSRRLADCIISLLLLLLQLKVLTFAFAKEGEATGLVVELSTGANARQPNDCDANECADEGALARHTSTHTHTQSAVI